MTRAFSEEVLLFLLPFALFAFWLLLRQRTPLRYIHWQGRVPWLFVAGLVCASGWVIYTGLQAPRGHGAYVPAHMENGVFVPGRLE